MKEDNQRKTISKTCFCGIPIWEIKEYKYTKYYYLFGFILLVQITRYPELGKEV